MITTPCDGSILNLLPIFCWPGWLQPEPRVDRRHARRCLAGGSAPAHPPARWPSRSPALAHLCRIRSISAPLQGDAVHLFDSNGAGVAIGDLDGDGRPDLVFANLDGPNTIFWNQGDFVFRKQALDDSGSRAVNLVDVDGDGLPDIVFTYRGGERRLLAQPWRRGHFARQPLPGVTRAGLQHGLGRSEWRWRARPGRRLLRYRAG